MLGDFFKGLYMLQCMFDAEKGVTGCNWQVACHACSYGTVSRRHKVVLVLRDLTMLLNYAFGDVPLSWVQHLPKVPRQLSSTVGSSLLNTADSLSVMFNTVGQC